LCGRAGLTLVWKVFLEETEEHKLLMKLTKRLPACLAAAAIALDFFSPPLFACAVCFGQSNSAQARGMTWGVLSLLFVIVCVLGGIGSFFIYLGRRAAVASATSTTERLPQSSEKVS
jgi:hypothetical protein